MRPAAGGSAGGRRWFRVLIAALVGVVAGNVLVSPLLPLYQRAWDLPPSSLTIIFAAYVVGIVVASVGAGGTSDVIGRRPLIVGGLALAALASAIALLAPGLWVLIAARVVQGLAIGVFTGAASAALIELPGGRSAAAGARANSAATVGAIAAGLLVAGALAEWAPAPLRLVWAVHLGALLVVWARIRRMPETRPATAAFALRPHMPRAPRRGRAVYALALASAFMMFAVVGLFAALGPSIVVDVVGIDSVLLGAVVPALVYVASTGVQLLVPLRPGAALSLGLAGLIPCVVLLALGQRLTSLALVIVAALIGGTAHGLAFRGSLAAVTTVSAPWERGGSAAGYFLAAYAGTAVPVVAVGVLADRIGIESASVVFAIVAGAVLATLAAGATALGWRPAAGAT